MSELRVNKILPKDGLPSGATGGGILQVKTVNKLDAGTLSSSYSAGTNYDISGLSLSITPSSSSNLIWIQGFVHHNVETSQQASFNVKRNGTIVSPIGNAGGGSATDTEEIGRLYGGDWMWFPWDVDDDICITPSVATDMTVEFQVFS